MPARRKARSDRGKLAGAMRCASMPRQAASRRIVPVFWGMSGWYRAMRMADGVSKAPLHSVGKGANRTPPDCVASDLPQAGATGLSAAPLALFSPRGEAQERAARRAGGRTARRKEGSRRDYHFNGRAGAPRLSFSFIRFPARLKA